MTDGVGIKIEGLEKVQRDLFAYGNKMGRKVMLDSLKVGGRIIQKRAKQNAPKKTGRLRRGITLRVSKIHKLNKNGKVGIYLGLRTGKGKDDPKDAFYGRFIEQGWNTHGKRTTDRRATTKRFGKRTGRKTAPGKTNVPAREFLHRAYISLRYKATKEIEKALFLGSDIIKRGTRLS